MPEKPEWLLIIEAWTAEGMGATGPTLPFVVGAMSYRSGLIPDDSSAIRSVLEEMATTRIDGHYIYVSWCPTVDGPVLSLREAPTPEGTVWSRAKAEKKHDALEFGADVRSRAGFNCADQGECIQKFVEDAWEHVARGNFSRNKGSSGLPEYGPFTPREIHFIAGLTR